MASGNIRGLPNPVRRLPALCSAGLLAHVIVFWCLAGSTRPAAALTPDTARSEEEIRPMTRSADGAQPSMISTSPTDLFVALDTVRLPVHLVLSPVAGRDRISREAAVVIALRNSPVLKAAREAVEMTRGDYIHSSAANNVQVNFGGSYTPNVRDSDSPDINDFPNRDLSYLQYTFPTSGRRKWSTRSAKGRWDAALATYRQAELDLTLATQSAYADLQQSQETVKVNEETWKIAHTFTELAKRQYGAGGVPYTNVISAEVTEGQAEQTLVTAHFDVQVKEKNLLFQLGERTNRRIGASDALDEAPMNGTLEEFQSVAMYKRPEVIAAMATLRGLEAQVGVAKADRRPDLTVQVTPEDVSSNSGGPPYKAFIQLPLFDRGQIGGNVIQARGAARQAQHNLEQERVQVSLDVASAYRQVQTTEGILTQEVNRILPNTRTLLAKTRLSYLAGASTILDVLFAQQTYRQENLNYVAAMGNNERNLATLARAMAAPVPRKSGHPFVYVPKDKLEDVPSK